MDLILIIVGLYLGVAALIAGFLIGWMLKLETRVRLKRIFGKNIGIMRIDVPGKRMATFEANFNELNARCGELGVYSIVKDLVTMMGGVPNLFYRAGNPDPITVKEFDVDKAVNSAKRLEAAISIAMESGKLDERRKQEKKELLTSYILWATAAMAFAAVVIGLLNYFGLTSLDESIKAMRAVAVDAAAGITTVG